MHRHIHSAQNVLYFLQCLSILRTHLNNPDYFLSTLFQRVYVSAGVCICGSIHLCVGEGRETGYRGNVVCLGSFNFS